MWPPKRRIVVCTNDSEREAVRHAQLVLKLPMTGELDDATRSHLRGIQRLSRIPQTGCLDPETAGVIDRMRLFDA